LRQILSKYYFKRLINLNEEKMSLENRVKSKIKPNIFKSKHKWTEKSLEMRVNSKGVQSFWLLINEIKGNISRIKV
jgi:hypothetical protein